MKSHTKNVEYRLLIVPSYDETLNKNGILFLLETTKQFTNFAYLIDVQDSLDGNELTFTLHGLRTPSMDMPTTGRAQFSKVFFDLPKKIMLTVVKKEKITAKAEIKFLKSGFTASKSRVSFLKIYLDETEFETKRMADTLLPELKPDIHRTIDNIKRKKNI
jgi:hypothetical protein